MEKHVKSLMRNYLVFIKNKLQKANFLSRLIRIRIFKVYMISKINHLLPLICLNGYLVESWKTIRKIIFRNILEKQTTPLETMISLGLGYFNLIIKPMLKLINKEYKFSKNDVHYKFLKSAAQKALIHWKKLEEKLPEEIDTLITEMINGKKWFEASELEKKIYTNIGTRLYRNNVNIEINLKDIRGLKYPNYLYLLSNAISHEIIDTILQKEKSKNEKDKELKSKRIKILITRMSYNIK